MPVIPGLNFWKNTFPGNLLYNTYDDFTNETACERDTAAKRILLLNAVGTKFNLGPDVMERWVNCLGERLTHVHANYMRTSDDVWTNPEVLDYDFRESLRLAGSAPLKTVTLEFTRGVGEKNEDRKELFIRALRGRKLIEKAWNL